MRLVRVVLAIAALLLVGCVGCAYTSGTITITGTVALAHYEGGVPSANVQPGEPASSVEVKLYTYKKPDQPQLPPVGDIIATTVAEEKMPKKRGNYHFEVQLDTLPQGCNKLVVFVDSGTEGYRVVEVVPGAIQVDLTKWSPALLIAMTITGVVAYRGSGAPATGIPVELYTYNPNSPFENFPCGREIKEAPTDKEGKYQLEVSEYELVLHY